MKYFFGKTLQDSKEAEIWDEAKNRHRETLSTPAQTEFLSLLLLGHVLSFHGAFWQAILLPTMTFTSRQIPFNLQVSI